MADPVYEGQNAAPITATAVINPGPCKLLGIFVSSASNTPTITVTDGTATPIATFVPGVGFYAMPFTTKTNLGITIGGTVSCTVLWGT